MENQKLVILKAITQAGIRENNRDPYEFLEKLLINQIAEKIGDEIKLMGYVIKKSDNERKEKEQTTEYSG